MGMRIFARHPEAPAGAKDVVLGLACDGGSLLCLAQGEVVFDQDGGFTAQRAAASRAGWLIRPEGQGYHVVGPCCRDHGGRVIRPR